MPVITVQLGRERTLETKRRLASGLTDIVADVLEVPRSEVTVLIEVKGRDNWATGGELLSDRGTKEREAPARLDLETLFRKPAAPVKATQKKAAAKSVRRR
jgi:4-oxalocrotonate tautomerase